MKNISILLVLLMAGLVNAQLTNTETLCPGQSLNQYVIYEFGDVYKYCEDCLCNVTAVKQFDNSLVLSNTAASYSGNGVFYYNLKNPPFIPGVNYRFTFSCNSLSMGSGITSSVVNFIECKDAPGNSNSITGGWVDDIINGLPAPLPQVLSIFNTIIGWTFDIFVYLGSLIAGGIDLIINIITMFFTVLSLIFAKGGLIDSPGTFFNEKFIPYMISIGGLFITANFAIFMLIETIIIFQAMNTTKGDILNAFPQIIEYNWKMLSVLFSALFFAFNGLIAAIKVIMDAFVGLLKVLKIWGGA